MIKKELISLVKNLLPKEDKTNKYHTEVIATAMGIVYANMLNDVFNQDPKELDNFVKVYTGQAVLVDANTLVAYSTLPVAYIPFRDKASGVRKIYAYSDGSMKRFYPMDSRESDLALSGSYFHSVGTRYGYVVKASRVEYFNMVEDGSARFTPVIMEVVPQFTALADDDNVIIPQGRENALLAGTLEIMGVVPPVDLKDDNADPQNFE